MIGIRVDANNKTAMGHIMRCLAIAKQLYALGKKIIFLVSDEFYHMHIMRRIRK